MLDADQLARWQHDGYLVLPGFKSLEALAALLILVFIVWWTMFAGRRGGERRDDKDE